MAAHGLAPDARRGGTTEKQTVAITSSGRGRRRVDYTVMRRAPLKHACQAAFPARLLQLGAWSL